MIHHIVCFRFIEGTSSERIEAAAASLLAMQGRIPEVRAVRWGANLAPSAGEYSHVLTVVLDDMEGVRRYVEHPVHTRVVAQHLTPIREARLAIDIEA